MPDPKRILQLCAVDFTAYHFLLPLMRAQREWGFRVELACSPGEYGERIEAEGFKVHAVPIARSANPLALARAYRGLRSLFADEPFTVVHAHTPVAALVGRPAARRAGVPAVLYTAHGFYFHDRMNPAKRRAHIALERWAQRRADYLMTQSEEDCATAIAERIAPADRARAIGNGVDIDRFRPDLLSDAERRSVREELGIGPNEGPVLAMMGRLVREKGYFELVDAWAEIARQHPAARAVFIGEALASDREDPAGKLRAKIAALGLGGSIVLAGLRADIPRLLAASDVFVLPSWREGMPRSIIEAMATGLPVVATNIRGSREEVVDGETGYLVPARDPGALADRVGKLLGDRGLRQSMGKAGRRRAELLFDERLVIGRLQEVYRQVFAQKGLAWPA